MKYSKKQRRQVCFTIDDFGEKDRVDPELASRLELAFPPVGAFTTKIDVSQDLYCLLIEAPDVQIEDLIGVFSQMGCNAHVKGALGEQS